MNITTDQLRFIIKEELSLVLETRKARDWIIKYAEKEAKKHFKELESRNMMPPPLESLIEENAEDMFVFYELGAKNIPDLSAIASWIESGDLVGAPQQIAPELKLYYGGKFKDLLKDNLGITQLKDFRSLGHFKHMMDDLAKYDRYERQQQAEKEAASVRGDLEKSEQGAVKIAQIGDWELLDPHIGEVSARCALGTVWCTKTPSTYDTYIKGDTKLYYLFNDKKAYPYNKISIGVDSDGFIWGGRGGKSVNAKNDGIESRGDALDILGKDGGEILKTLQDYYRKDAEFRKRTKSSKYGLTDEVYIENHLNFLRKVKQFKKNSGLRINFYKNLITFLEKRVQNPIRYARDLLPTFKYILNDKEMKKTKYAPEDKKFIKDKIIDDLATARFINRLTDKQRQENFDVIYDALKERSPGKNGKIDHFKIYQSLIRHYRDTDEFKEHRSKALEELTKERKSYQDDISDAEQNPDVSAEEIQGLKQNLKDVNDKLTFIKVMDEKNEKQMKLTTNQLRFIIKEELQHLLEEISSEEAKQFGPGIAMLANNPDKIYSIKEFPAFEGDPEPEQRQFLEREWIIKHVGPELGAGSFRDTYLIRDNPNYVLKISNRFMQDEPDDGQTEASVAEKTNQHEIEQFNKNTDYFPRVYIHDKEKPGIPRWLVVDRVEVIEDFRELILTN